MKKKKENKKINEKELQLDFIETLLKFSREHTDELINNLENLDYETLKEINRECPIFEGTEHDSYYCFSKEDQKMIKHALEMQTKGLLLLAQIKQELNFKYMKEF